MPFGSLWLPVIVSAVAVFVVSSVLHMVLKYHKSDYKKLPGEEAVREALGKGALPPGLYPIPHCAEMSEMREPAMMEKYAKGPVALIAVLPNGAPAMPKLLGMWFAFSLLISFVVGYVARHSLTAATDGYTVLRVTSAIAFCAYGIAHISNAIWFGQPWSNTVRSMIDSLIYSITTGICFRLLWPQ